MDHYDVAIIGAGPAGLFCAIHVAGPGIRVLLLEKNATPGVKLTISGTGQCNITHDGDIRTFFSRYGTHGAFIRPALLSFTNKALISFFAERGLCMEITEGGKIFPESRNAHEVCDILVNECRKRGVFVACGDPVKQVEQTDTGFIIRTSGMVYSSNNLVLACGGSSYPKTGSTGDGYRIAASLGHTITDIGPALAPLIIKDFPFSSLTGMTFPEISFSVWRMNRKITEAKGDIVFTHNGLSGPGVLDHSRNIRPGDWIRLSFIGPVQRNVVVQEILAIIAKNPAKTIKTLIAGMGVPERLSRLLPEMVGIPTDSTGAHLTTANRNRLIDTLTGCQLEVLAVGDLSVAMVTRGGVALAEVDPKTMASKRVPGLFFAGEILDIDGDTGGFNLQAAFSTGFLAAHSIRSCAGKYPD
ncbi:NAD(P)/FAD-dependent oxidoreductase [Methanoregula sp.]|uniref:NAD(P)/FAD-dependent oxidoreductase n=1 Tax=Methanoregula sp. TaxID=2052170 RepID=UPI003C72ED7D